MKDENGNIATDGITGAEENGRVYPISSSFILHPSSFAWTPREWVCNCFPQPAAGVEVVSLDYIMAALDQHTANITEADSTPLGAAMHAAHILVTLQGTDGLWPARLNLRTGRGTDEARSAAPLPLMRRLNALLYSTEYDPIIRRAEAALAQLPGTQFP